MTPLRQRMIDDMTLHRPKPKTIKTYVACIARFARHFCKSPEVLGTAEIRSYLLCLAHNRHAASSTYNQALCALKIRLPSHTWQGLGPRRSLAHPTPDQAPGRLEPRGSHPILPSHQPPPPPGHPHDRLCGGLRISEFLALRVDDIDSQRMVIRVDPAKGSKDRYVIL